MLEPHRCYLRELKPFLRKIKGLAHITGGGIPGNLPRTLPKGIGARIKKSTWEPPPIFRLVQEAGNIEEEEMFRVFNMGIGMIVIGDESLLSIPSSFLIGEIVEGEGVIIK